MFLAGSIPRTFLESLGPEAEPGLFHCLLRTNKTGLPVLTSRWAPRCLIRYSLRIRRGFWSRELLGLLRKMHEGA